MKRHLQILFLLLACISPLAAEVPADEAMESFNRGNFDPPILIEVLPKLADPAKRAGIRSILMQAEKPPRPELVALLEHPLLAVRLGALEVLEEFAGGDLSFNPWAPADSPENAAALARWNAWARNPADPSGHKEIFTGDQRRAYLQDILADNPDKAARARRMLEAEGLSAVGFLENFLKDTPTLDIGHRARIREAQYQITLSGQLGDQAAITARNLAFGSRDQILSALTTVRSAGLLALPILRDFITHADPLVRENAIDSLLVTGGEPAVSIVAPLLQHESDVNVIHGALRRLKDVPCEATLNLVVSFLNHPDEDLLISAIQTSLSLSGDNTNDHGSPSHEPAKNASPADAAIITALDDKRWRVRATALEYITKHRIPASKEKCLSMLGDSDDFVRFAAIKALSALGAKDALPKLKAMFLADENMAGPVFEGYGALEQEPDAQLLERLDNVSPEARLAVLRAVESNKSLGLLPLRYANDKNADVACAALRHIAADSENLEKDRNASILVTALRSGQPEKVEAILERLDLPKSKRVDRAILETLGNGLAGSEPTALDALYNAFLQPGSDTIKQAEIPTLPLAQQELVRELILRTTPQTPVGDRFRAALNLAKASHSEGFTVLLRDLPSLTTAQKTAIGETLYEPSIREALPLLAALLRDPLPEVRASAASCALSNDKSPAFLELVLSELKRPGSPLQPHETYDYHFESIFRSKKLATPLRNWGVAVLQSPDAGTPLKVLATVGLRNIPATAVIEEIEKCTSSPDPLLRRAAWHTLFTLRPASISTSAERVMADHEAFVRVVLPQILQTGDEKFWNHHFSDVQVLRDHRWTYNQKQVRVSDSLKKQLGQLATQDPSPLVRFESAFTLLSQGGVIDIADFAAQVPQLPKETMARERITSWLAENAARATPGLSPLLAIIDPSKIKPQQMKQLNERISPAKGEGFATFSALAQVTPPADVKSGGLLAAETKSTEPAKRSSLDIVYFFKPGCPECHRAKQYLEAIQGDFPLLKIHEHNLLESAGTVLNQALCNRFSVPSARHTLSPAIFTQSGFLIREDISPQALASLFSKTMAVDQDNSWMEIGVTEQKAAVASVDRRYAAFTLPVVIGAGLLDGINPCAFATIIFFLSYLQIARRTPREMLMVGAAFISAVFIAYLAAGLILYQSLAALNDRFAGIQKWMNLGFALLAILAAALSFRDAWRIRGGRMDEMTLQLPGFLKNRIRGVIRSGAKARNFVVAAFVSGIIVSLLELACTGQVYAPIIYQIQQGRLDAVIWLVIYNLAFITPLIVIFLLAYGGLSSESLIDFQKKHTTAVKIGLGILFLVLAVLILVGQKWLAPH